MVKQKDPAARTSLEILLAYSGLHAVILHRIAHWFYLKKCFLIARLISQFSRFLTGIEIHCLIYQGVTLGGTGKEHGKRHPTLGNNVMVGSGARVLGPFKVGDNAKIAANAVVLAEVPENSTAVGVPARIVKIEGQRVNKNQDLDQVHIPDPVSLELCKQLVKIEELEREIEKLKAEKNKLKIDK